MVAAKKFEEADVVTQNLQYLYSDDNTIYFMNPDTFEELNFDKESGKDLIVF